jgi:signal transduction histidine kinase
MLTREKIALEHHARDIAEELLEDSKNESQIYLDLMGHDINNLNQISLGYLELFLESPQLNNNDRMLVGKAYDALQNSSQLISNIRNVQRARLGEAKLHTVDLNKVIVDVKNRYAHVRGRSVTINYIPVDGCYVKANDIITDVFCNLVGNALRHSPSEKPLFIDIAISKVKENDLNYYKVTVEDNGPGISDTNKDKLFKRLSHGLSKSVGIGMGLFLVKTLVESYNGKVWVEDRVTNDYTKGAKFIVMLPAI